MIGDIHIYDIVLPLAVLPAVQGKLQRLASTVTVHRSHTFLGGTAVLSVRSKWSQTQLRAYMSHMFGQYEYNLVEYTRGDSNARSS